MWLHVSLIAGNDKWERSSQKYPNHEHQAAGAYLATHESRNFGDDSVLVFQSCELKKRETNVKSGQLRNFASMSPEQLVESVNSNFSMSLSDTFQPLIQVMMSREAGVSQ